ncbi:group II intron reverse transcriptase/maturase (plasmid) [Bacillus mycoides]|uniref:group II intron reverse transcriptase/maturase n=1 Tax=Bacillus mycoides TaxID=1405 RepID=UPI003F74D80A
MEVPIIYNAEVRGLYEYYKLVNNVSILNKCKYIMEYSIYKTFANKYKTSVKECLTNMK